MLVVTDTKNVYTYAGVSLISLDRLLFGVFLVLKIIFVKLKLQR